MPEYANPEVSGKSRPVSHIWGTGVQWHLSSPRECKKMAYDPLRMLQISKSGSKSPEQGDEEECLAR